MENLKKEKCHILNRVLYMFKLTGGLFNQYPGEERKCEYGILIDIVYKICWIQFSEINHSIGRFFLKKKLINF